MRDHEDVVGRKLREAVDRLVEQRIIFGHAVEVLEEWKLLVGSYHR